MNNKVCPTCGATILEGNRYCIECGTAVEQSDSFTPVVEQPTMQNTPVQPASEQQYTYGQPTYQQSTYNQSSYGQEQGNQTSYQQGQQNTYQQAQYQQYSYQQSPKNDSVPGEDSPYQPISVWGFVGIMLLMCVPCVGLILLIVWACGGCRKVNKKNYARAALIVMVISTILSVVMWLIFGAVVGTVMEESGIASIYESEDGGFDYDTLAALDAIGDGDFSALEDLSDEQLEILSNVAGVEMSDLENLMETYSDAEYDDEYYEDEYYDDYEEKSYEDEYDGWPADYMPPYPSGEGEYVTSSCTAFCDTTVEEMKTYIDDLKAKGFAYADLYENDMTEEDMLDLDMWTGTDGYMYVIMYYGEGELYIDHSTNIEELVW